MTAEGKIAPSATRSESYEAKRLDILRKAALAFAEDGYHETTVNSLALRLGVSKPVLYYYAKNKDDLLLQCGKIARSALDDAMEEANVMQASGMGRVRRFFNAYAEIMCGDFGRCLVIADHRSMDHRELEQTVQQLIRDGQEDGSIGPCDPALATRALFGAFNGIPRWFHADGVLGSRDIADAYLDLFVTGMGRG